MSTAEATLEHRAACEPMPLEAVACMKVTVMGLTRTLHAGRTEGITERVQKSVADVAAVSDEYDLPPVDRAGMYVALACILAESEQFGEALNVLGQVPVPYQIVEGLLYLMNCAPDDFLDTEVRTFLWSDAFADEMLMPLLRALRDRHIEKDPESQEVERFQKLLFDAGAEKDALSGWIESMAQDGFLVDPEDVTDHRLWDPENNPDMHLRRRQHILGRALRFQRECRHGTVDEDALNEFVPWLLESYDERQWMPIWGRIGHDCVEALLAGAEQCPERAELLMLRAHNIASIVDDPALRAVTILRFSDVGRDDIAMQLLAATNKLSPEERVGFYQAMIGPYLWRKTEQGDWMAGQLQEMAQKLREEHDIPSDAELTFALEDIFLNQEAMLQ